MTGLRSTRANGARIGRRRTDRPQEVPARLDVRLLLPALAGWAVVVWALGWPVALAGLLGCAAAAGSLGVLLLGRFRPESREAARIRRRLAAAILAVIAAVLVAVWGAGQHRQVGPLGRLAGERAAVVVRGTVVEGPRPLVPRAGQTGDRTRVVATLAVEEVSARGSRWQVDAPVLLLGDQRLADLAWRGRIELHGTLSGAEPGDDVVAILAPSAPPSVLEQPPAIVRGAEYLRSRFRDAMQRLPPDPAGLVPALVVGDTSGSPPELTADMSETGLTHLSAVSGSNVSIVLAAVIGLARLTGLRRRWRPVVAGLVLIAFVILVRPEPSVIRAGVMGLVGLIGLSSARRATAVPALSAAVIAILMVDPWLARSYGFALSTLATLGLLLFAQPWGTRLGRRLPAWAAAAGPALAVPAAAQLACAPVLVLLNPSVSLVAIPANLVAEPLVAPATIGGIATALLAGVCLPLARWLAWVPGLPAWLIAGVAHVGANVPGRSIPWVPGAPGALLLAAVEVGFVLAGPAGWRLGRRHPVAALVALLCVSAGAVPVSSRTWPVSGWQFVVCDVGQGDALVLAAGPGRAVVIDAGPDPALVDGCLRDLGVDHVDALVLTHFHADHVDGLPGVLRGRTVSIVLTDGVPDPLFQADEVARWVSDAQVPMRPLVPGEELVFGQVRARAWWPERVIHQGSVPNNASVVLTAQVGGLRLLLLGDIEREAAGALLPRLRAAGLTSCGCLDVVKVAHHGSANRLDALYAEVGAPLAVISVGVGNDYGHPAAATLAALTGQGARVARTDLEGALAVRRNDDGTIALARSGPR